MMRIDQTVAHKKIETQGSDAPSNNIPKTTKENKIGDNEPNSEAPESSSSGIIDNNTSSAYKTDKLNSMDNLAEQKSATKSKESADIVREHVSDYPQEMMKTLGSQNLNPIESRHSITSSKQDEVVIPLKVMLSKGFDQERRVGLVEKLLCGCWPLLVRVILCASLGSFLFGFNLALLNTSMTMISIDFGWCDLPGDAECKDATLKQSFTNTGVFIGAALGSMTGGRFLFIGRRMAFLLILSVFGVGIITSILASSFATLLWARLIVGYGVGVVSVVIPIYMSEMSPPKSRGFYGVFHQLFITIGIFIAVLLGLPFGPDPTEDEKMTYEIPLFNKIWWRVMLGLGLIPVVIALYFLVFVMTFETPHYYVENDVENEARKVLHTLHHEGESVEEELHGIIKAREDATIIKEKGLTFFAAMKRPMYRHVILVGCLLSAFQQLSGINVFIASSNGLFSDAGLSRSLVTTMSIVLTFVNVVMTFPAIALIDRLGRRSLMLIGTIGMGISVLPGAVLLWVNSQSEATTWVAIAGSIVFIIFFSGSYGPVLWVYLFEIYPLEIKGLASGLATAVNWISGIVMVFAAQFIPVEVNYTIFCCTSLLASLIVFLMMKETKGRTLEESPYITREL